LSARTYTFAELRDFGGFPVYYSRFRDAAVKAARASLFSFPAHREIPQRIFSSLFAGVVYLHYDDHGDEQHVNQNEILKCIS